MMAVSCLKHFSRRNTPEQMRTRKHPQRAILFIAVVKMETDGGQLTEYLGRRLYEDLALLF